MALPRRTLPLLASAALLAPLAAPAAGPALAAAEAASACGRFGDKSGAELRAAQARRAITCLLNRKRAKRGLPRLKSHRKLQRAAQRHTDYMRRKRCFDHRCGGEPDLGVRVRRVGYIVAGLSRWAYGENIAWGEGSFGTPKAIVKAWMRSPGHRANILNRDFRDIGVGFARGTPYSPRANGGIYTTDFGLRRR